MITGRGARRTRLAWLAALAACGGETGTLQLELATAPGSPLLANLERVRLTVTNPRAVYEATRDAGGLDLAFELEATTDNGVLIIEGFDGSGSLAAVGQSPPFALSGADARVVIYVAPPFSIREAPERMPPARSAIGGATLPYGVIFGGGLSEATAPTSTIAVYNAYDHTVSFGMEMPVQRSALTVAANLAGNVYLFGGLDASAQAQGTLHLFQSTVAPAGAYVDLGTQPDLARAGARAYAVAPDAFLVSGTPPLVMASATLRVREDLASLSAIGAEVLAGTERYAVTVDLDTVTVASLDTTGTIMLPAPVVGGAVAPLPDGAALVLDGARGGYVIDVLGGTATRREDLLAEPRISPAVAATPRHIVIAGGNDATATPIASAEILDAVTLEHLATIPFTARQGVLALPLPNDQIIFAGGLPATDAIELFTPPVPSDPAPP